jgi:uncharacterized membrane protein YbhN (UPF0104 family)
VTADDAVGPTAVRTGWRRWWPFVRPVVLLAVGVVVLMLVVRFVGAIDWSAVADSLSQLNAVEVVALVLALLLRQTLNAVPLSQFVPGLRLGRSMQNDLTANLVGTMAPPPADVVLRVSMFRSWGLDPVDGMAGVTLNMLAFYSVRFLVPVLGLLVLAGYGIETGQLLGALGSLCIALGILVGLLLVVRGDGLATLVGRTAGRVVRRFRSSVQPEAWAEAVVGFRGRMAGNVRAGLARSMLALVCMVLADALVLTLALRFVGLGADQVSVPQVVGTFLVAYPLTLMPLAGFGVLDAALLAAFVEIAGVVAEPQVVAGLVVWRSVTILGPLLLGLGCLLWWRRSGQQDADDGAAVVAD